MLEYRAELLQSLASARITVPKQRILDDRNPIEPTPPEGREFVIEVFGNAYHIYGGNADAGAVLREVAEKAEIRVIEGDVNIATSAPPPDTLQIAKAPNNEGRVAVLSASNSALRRLQEAARTLLREEQDTWVEVHSDPKALVSR